MFELRSYRPEDAEAVWGLHDAALEGAGVHGGRGPWEDDLRDIAGTYLDPGGEFLLAFDGGALVGMGGLLRRSSEEAEITRMRVRPDRQRRGLGRRILAALEGRAGELGFERVRLDTTEEQAAARKLYERAGYREVGRRTTDRFVFVDFVKSLGASKSPVLVLTGPPGVGKTTVAGILALRSPRAVHLESDVFFRFVRSGYVEPWKPESHEQNSVVMGIVARAAAGYAAAGYETIVDGIVIPGWFLPPLAGMLEGAGHTVAYAVLRAPVATCIERVRGREGVPLERGPIEQLCQSFADLGGYERNAIELHGEEPEEEVADIVSRRLASGQLAI
ncbi:MAG TPA: GNAT family N-acetyltransferase [Solirubrobacterales bacterium]